MFHTAMKRFFLKKSSRFIKERLVRTGTLRYGGQHFFFAKTKCREGTSRFFFPQKGVGGSQTKKIVSGAPKKLD